MLLKVYYDSLEDVFSVVNTFDGVVVAEFLHRADAEDFTFSEELNEQHRIRVEYNIG